MNNTKYICECVNEHKEFEYIEQISKYYSIKYEHLCNFTLDFYNYQRRNGLDKVGAKIMSLQNATDYAYNHGDWTKKQCGVKKYG